MYYFASDVHLGAGGAEASARTEKRFLTWLDRVSHDAKEIWLLGDIFDFWFEYGRVVPKGFVRVLGKLAGLSDRGIRIVWLTGNHDMWMRGYLTEECGVEIFTQPVSTELAGRKMFLAHGDNMQIKGKPLLKLMNWGFRSRVVRFLASWLIHPDLTVRLAHWWSGKSRKMHGSEADTSILEPLKSYAAELGRTSGVECCIFGHLHIADDSTVGGTRVLFLSDWSGDAPVYAKMSDAGEISLQTYEEQ